MEICSLSHPRASASLVAKNATLMECPFVYLSLASNVPAKVSSIFIESIIFSADAFAFSAAITASFTASLLFLSVLFIILANTNTHNKRVNAIAVSGPMSLLYPSSKALAMTASNSPKREIMSVNIDNFESSYKILIIIGIVKIANVTEN